MTDLLLGPDTTTGVGHEHVDVYLPELPGHGPGPADSGAIWEVYSPEAPGQGLEHALLLILLGRVTHNRPVPVFIVDGLMAVIGQRLRAAAAPAAGSPSPNNPRPPDDPRMAALLQAKASDRLPALHTLINATDWVARGLPAELNLRIGLHAGPVFRYIDPVTVRPGYFGTHISRAARIEPITPPGQVYASEAFAALDSASHTFTCEYVGQTPQAKGYGTFPTYHVRST